MKRVIYILCFIMAFGLRPGISQESGDESLKFDLSSLQKVDPDLIKYSETGAIPVPFVKASCLAVAKDGNLWVGGDGLVLLDADGAVKKKIDINGHVNCVAVAEDGRVFAGLADHVEVFELDGKSSAVWADLSAKSILTSIAFGDGKVFLADAGEKTVWVFSETGALLRRIGDRTNERRGFIIPSPYFDVAVGIDGTVWAVNTGAHTLENFKSDGMLVRQWKKTSAAIDGFCGCCNPTHLAIMPDGSFVTAEKGLVRVKIYSANGDFQCVVAAPSDFTTRGQKGTGSPIADIAVDVGGRVMILDSFRKSVRIFERKKGAL